jgi:hypothetical protein
LATEYVCKEIHLREWVTVQFVPLHWMGHGEVQIAPNRASNQELHIQFLLERLKAGDLSHF